MLNFDVGAYGLKITKQSAVKVNLSKFYIKSSKNIDYLRKICYIYNRVSNNFL